MNGIVHVKIKSRDYNSKCLCLERIICNLRKQIIYKVLNKIHDCIVLTTEGLNKRLLLSYQYQLWHEYE